MKTELDGVLQVGDEHVYNKTIECVTKFNKTVFLKNHKSYYSEINIDILHEYRTLANNGLFNHEESLNFIEEKGKYRYVVRNENYKEEWIETEFGDEILNIVQNNDNLVEIDISKAYTHSLSLLKEIPIFNIFDNFEPHLNEEINDLSLYIIKNEELNLFFNKKYGFCYENI